jgi:hypothetical protein
MVPAPPIFSLPPSRPPWRSCPLHLLARVWPRLPSTTATKVGWHGHPPLPSSYVAVGASPSPPLLPVCLPVSPLVRPVHFPDLFAGGLSVLCAILVLFSDLSIPIPTSLSASPSCVLPGHPVCAYPPLAW